MIGVYNVEAFWPAGNDTGGAAGAPFFNVGAEAADDVALFLKGKKPRCIQTPDMVGNIGQQRGVGMPIKPPDLFAVRTATITRPPAA